MTRRPGGQFEDHQERDYSRSSRNTNAGNSLEDSYAHTSESGSSSGGELGTRRGASDGELSHMCSNPDCDWSPRKNIHGIEIERVEEGWIFRANGRECGPVADIMKFEPKNIAESLGVEPEKATFARLTASDLEVKRPLTIEDLARILDVTVKRDYENKIVTFLCMLSAYTEDSQFNVSFRAESSTGKSYIPLEIAELFPPSDIEMVAYSSPTAFYHDKGEWDEDEQVKKINLERKILIFLDQPHDQLLERLRPLLSHDRKELIYKITDKKEKAGLRTKTVKIIGFPAVIFCTGKLRTEDQEATRMILLSPEISQEKIREAIYLRAMREGDKEAFTNWVESNPERRMLKERIRRIKDAGIKDARILKPEKIAEQFMNSRRILKPRHTRDISRLFSLIKAVALLNLWHRKCDGDVIEASDEDVEQAFKLYETIMEAQELGIPPFVLQVYKEVIKPLCEENDGRGVSRKDIAKRFLTVFGRPISEWILRREILQSLEEAGLITQEQDPSDRRRVLVHVIEIQPTPPSSPLYSEPAPLEKYSGHSGGVNGVKDQNMVDAKVGYWNPSPGVCEVCGEEASERYSVKIHGTTRFACRKCASEAVA